ncbi:hypothetical protein [Alkalimarinus alittae]|uniref:Uncharacterized protein n=1 Tax=Alkalimarinus alittae TaxID=2961619 RepID=A0ABY6MZQ3_9ALTE|nr:hypothetical protein [Alkalimarinus alittae]UZE95322.1 hypothetical protein NKI27_14800 [Alkalimarinus alittae]
MLLAKARKISHHIVGPLVLLWLLCQSMVLCAGLLDNGGSDPTLASSTLPMTASMSGHHSSDHHGMVMSQAGTEPAHHHATIGDTVSADCCDEQGSYLYNSSTFSSIVFLLFFPLYWLILSLRQRLKQSTYYREPPPHYNYPRSHVVNCTFLN